MVPDSEFKVIVVGGGPVGLTAAHALAKAGIDYVLLEHRREVVIDVGASLVVWPQGFRILTQLGILEPLTALGVELGCTRSLELGGHKYKTSWATEAMKKNAADKARVLTGKQVVDIESGADGVVVHCKDGSAHRGSMVVGADGVHSLVRQRMRHLALSAASPKVNDEHPYACEYRLFWCTFLRPVGCDLAAGDAVEVHGKDSSLQCLNGADRSWLFIYERLAAPPPRGTRVSYTAADIDALAMRNGDHAVSETLRVRDVLPLRCSGGMSDLEEGVVEHWSFGRVVLAGDACHNMTPNQGLGYNNGIQDIAVLLNELHGALRDHHATTTTSSMPKTPLPLTTLTGVFDRYQSSRSELLARDYAASVALTRASSWHTWADRALDRHVFPAIPFHDELVLNTRMSRNVAQAPVLRFVRCAAEPFVGRIKWRHALSLENEDGGGMENGVAGIYGGG
ncbi:hypothetical protein B0T26DRAFT_809909 [Lasiosphaeria miniovina]|uniref:FAD-binding domain-containing protein n=1 Tax=Lasiosphaeria miniovina TaxID=1954250 RepID=A0AA40E858_9PEZI|nr:uncharacterized protein B0T26DRAFT_809909 [Lasiosphaeria miniovina]KAK0727551.1 hypothetical protein B0T26DRAFT_809909 [Lasiosphaeria miniovina]